MAELAGRLGRASDLDALVEVTVRGLAELLGYEHSMFAMRDEGGEHLYVIASHGYDAEGVGSELAVGEGPIGLAAQNGTPVRVGALKVMRKYGSTVRRTFEAGGAAASRDIAPPMLADGQSVVAVPAMAMGQLIGVLAIESAEPVAYDETDQQLLSVVATLVANAVETDRVRETEADPVAVGAAGPAVASAATGAPTRVRHYAQDGSVFIDDGYLIKGVAGRILAALLRTHRDEGRVEFTNRELRLDTELGLPEYRANLESRLILLKRRLDEREVPVRIEKTGRGRFRLQVTGSVELVEVLD